MKKRVLSVLLSATMVAGMLAGCGGGGDSAATSGSAGSDSNATEETGGSPDAAEGEDRKSTRLNSSHP